MNEFNLKSMLTKPLRHFLHVIALALSFYSAICSAQELVIGVPLAELPLNLVASDHPFAQFIRNAATQPLLRREDRKNSGLQLVLADSFSTSLDGKAMEIRLRPGASFINSELVAEGDLKASFERCLARPGPTVSFNVEAPPKFTVSRKQQRIFVSVESVEGQKTIIDFVGKCPIFEERSLRLFRADLGMANLILATGPYHLVARARNREARLERVSHSAAWAAAITVRGFSDPEQALTALRSGTVDAFYTQDSEAYAKASKDPTLLISPCGVYNIILRKGLEIGCYPSLDPGSIKYSAL